jgi:FkbM family methyltransferase
MAAARLSPLLACLPHALGYDAMVGGDAVDASASFVDDAARSTRTWPRCNFQSIRDDPIDQFVFTLFGGRLDDWQRDFMAPDGCDVWARPTSRRSCACTAPLKLVGSGTFVEIGANDGLHMSNSWFFERHLGWRGMCVEANPQVFRRLQQNRPDCVNVNALVGSSERGSPSRVPFVSFYREPGEEKAQTARDWETGLSGVEGSEHGGNHEITSFARAQRFAARSPGLLVARDMLPVESFARLFARHNFSTVDFLSIDVEGNELAVLRTIDFRRTLVGVVVTEVTSKEVSLFLRKKGFRDLGVVFRLGDHVFLNKRLCLRADERCQRNGQEV